MMQGLDAALSRRRNVPDDALDSITLVHGFCAQSALWLQRYIASRVCHVRCLTFVVLHLVLLDFPLHDLGRTAAKT